jgi:hypothetical protein
MANQVRSLRRLRRSASPTTRTLRCAKEQPTAVLPASGEQTKGTAGRLEAIGGEQGARLQDRPKSGEVAQPGMPAASKPEKLALAEPRLELQPC